MTVEESFVELDSIMEKLDNRDISLEEAFKEYERGIKIIKECNESLDKVEKDIIVLQNEE